MKIVALRDGTNVVLRTQEADDLPRFMRFIQGLDAEDQRYLRIDPRRTDLIERRLRLSASGAIYRVFAVVDDDIIAEGLLELSSEGWQRHLAEIRVFVSPAWRRHKLGARLIQDLFEEAQRREVDKVVARMAAPQMAARKVFERLGFSIDAVLPDYFKDADGGITDVLVMSCQIGDVWRELRDFYAHDDWPDG